MTLVGGVVVPPASAAVPVVYAGACPLLTLAVTFNPPLTRLPDDVTVEFSGTATCVVARDGIPNMRDVTLWGTGSTVLPTFSCLAGVAVGMATVSVPTEPGFGTVTGMLVLTYYGAGATTLTTTTTPPSTNLEGAGSFVQDPTGDVEEELLDVVTCPVDNMSDTTWTGSFAFTSVRDVPMPGGSTAGSGAST